MGLAKFLLLPQLVYYSARAPRAPNAAWDHFWSGVRRTGFGGDVLWDAESKEELDRVLERTLARADRSLPMVDVGCGNGRFSRLFAPHFPQAIGIDVAPHAIERAREESRGIANVSYRVLDAGVPGVGGRLAAELGDVNVYLRGVLHVIEPEQQRNLVYNLRDMVGKRGVLYLVETNYEDDPLDSLVARGVTPTWMPEPLRRCIASGLPTPTHFGDAQLRGLFNEDGWQVMESGNVVIHGLPVRADEAFELIPAYYAILRTRS